MSKPSPPPLPTPNPVDDFLDVGGKRDCVFIIRLHGDPPREGDDLGIIKIPKECSIPGKHANCVLQLPKNVYILHTTPPSYNTWSDEVDKLIAALIVGTDSLAAKKAAAAVFFSFITCPQTDKKEQFTLGAITAAAAAAAKDSSPEEDATDAALIRTQLYRYSQLYSPLEYIYNYNLHYEDNSKIIKLNADKSEELINDMHCFCMKPTNCEGPCCVSGRLQSGNYKLSEIICDHIINHHSFLNGRGTCDKILIILTSCNPDPPPTDKSAELYARVLIRNMLATHAKMSWTQKSYEAGYIFTGPQDPDKSLCNNCNFIGRDGKPDYTTDLLKRQHQCDVMSAKLKQSLPDLPQGIVGIWSALLEKFHDDTFRPDLIELLKGIGIDIEDFRSLLSPSVYPEGGGRSLRNKRKSRNRKSKRRTQKRNKGKRKKTGGSKRRKRSKRRSKRRNSRRMKRRSRK
jgi:hypothetical protein